jgi:tetratricopeptide (TPR) repeat protein
MQQLFSQQVTLFYAYAYEDQKFCETLDKHLTAMKRLGWLRTWYDREIGAGQIWEDEINQHLSTADIILVLVSADFLASDYCYSVELKYALQRHAMDEAVVVPIIVRPVDWSMAPFHMLHPLPTDGKAIVNWTNRDQAFFDVVQGLRRIIEQKRSTPISPHDLQVSSDRFWTVPYRQNQFFTGREKLLEQISSYFFSHKGINTPVVALSGLGGMGKTQMALEYAYRSSEHYHAIFWMNASSQNMLIADIIALADRLGIPSRKDRESQAVVSFVKRWLSDHSHWLLILDAISDPSLAMDLFPLKSSGYILLTTQASVSRAVAYSVEVEKLSERDALTFLLRRSGLQLEEQPLSQIASEDIKVAQHICRELDGLPLALDQAGAYIEETGCSLTEYYQRYQKQQLAILSLRGSMSTEHPASVVTTWSLSFEHFAPRDPYAADLLRGCAFLAADAIPQDIFLRGSAYLGPHLATLLIDETHFDAAIKTLRRFSLVKRQPRSQTISLHRLVQVVLRSQMEPEMQVLWAGRVVQALCAAFPHQQEQEWGRCALYIPHVNACEKLLDHYHLNCPEACVLFYHAGRFFHEHAQYAQAEYFYQQALTYHERLLDNVKTESLVQILDSLGWLALDQGQFSQAEQFFRRSHLLKEQVYGHEHIETAITLHALGRVAHAQFAHQNAEALYIQALHIKEQIVGDEHAETATTLQALGWLLQDQGRDEEAQSYYQRAFEIRSKVLGIEHMSTAVTLHQLARLAHRQKQYEQAEQLYLQSLSIKERIVGAEHPFTAIAMDALARVYQDQGRSEEAEAFYQRALTIRKQYFGLEHQFTAQTAHHLGCLYQEQGQLQQAEVFLLQALTVREHVLGSNHPITAISLHQLARLFSTQKRWQQAEEMYQRALAIREQTFGRAHPAILSIVKGYAHLLRSLQRDTDAEALEQR